MTNKKTTRYYLLVLSFFSGMAIMAVELCASRLIAPYFGTSTLVWADIIGSIMLALAVGYNIGGRLADKKPEMKYLLKIIIIACIYLLAIPFLVKPLAMIFVGNFIFLKSVSLLVLGSLFIIFVLFVVPVALLGVVSPFIIKLLSLLDGNIGKDAGLVFSISTFGSLVGTFLPVMVLIPFIGTRKTIIIFVLALLFICLYGLINKKGYLILIFLIFLAPLVFFKFPVIKPAEGAIAEKESVYQYMAVIDDENYRYLSVNEGLGVQSILSKNPDNVLTGYYYDYYNLLPYLSGNDQRQDILVLGVAGGVISTQLNYFFSQDHDLHIDGVEIDPDMIKIANEYFGLDNPSLTMYNMDGRNFVDYYDKGKKYNSIVIDAYSVQLYISFHLTTKEFMQSVKSRLKENGVVAMNVNSTSADSALLKNITNTMLSVFNHVYYIQEDPKDWNYMVLASDNELDFNKLAELIKNQEFAKIIDNAANNNQEVQYDNNFGYLTDDKAPIEHLTEWMIVDYLYKNKVM